MSERWILLAVAFTVAWPLQAASSQPPFAHTQDPVAGARLFETKGCVHCHAIDGVGGQEGPDLARIDRPRSFYDLAAAMWNHLPQMAKRIWASLAARPYFTPDEMSDVVAFLYPRTQTPGDVERERRFLGAPGDPQRGRRLVAEKGCLGCHALSAPGRGDAGSLDRLKGVDSSWTVVATMWNHAFLMELKSQAQRTAWPRLSAEEMADLVAFLRVQSSRAPDR